MFCRASATLARRAICNRPTPFLGAAARLGAATPRFVIPRSMVTVKEALTAEDARKVSGYNSIDYTIGEDMTVYDAVQKFAAFNIGCLVVTNSSGKLRYLFVTSVLNLRFFVACRLFILTQKLRQS